MAFYQLHRKQIIRASLEEVWDFISSPANLKNITPEYMDFNIISTDLPDKIYPGMIISYTVKPALGIKMKWVTEITYVEEKKYFVDEQIIGPYSFWHHQHILESTVRGVIMMDIVSYKPPLGLVGAFANVIFIRRRLNEIFTYREKALEHRFPGFEMT